MTDQFDQWCRDNGEHVSDSEGVVLEVATTTCSCVRHGDGSVTTMLCSLHADNDPCQTMATVTGRRRQGSIRRGVCSACGWNGRVS